MADDQPFKISGTNLQAYIKEQVAKLELTRPGYEIYFYSRMDTKTSVITAAPNTSNTVLGTVGLQGFDNGSYATYTLKSSTDSGSISYVNTIEVMQSIGDDGSSCKIVLANPPDVVFFQTHLGVGTTDYDASEGQPVHQIGVMDTVLVKLSNLKDNLDDPSQRETVFRGVISDIQRSETVEGAYITLTCYDFSLFLRRAMAIKSGIFSTISISFTGRGLVYNGLNYTNNLLNGNKQILGSKIDQNEYDAVLNSVNSSIKTLADASPHGGLITNNNIPSQDLADADAALQFDKHAMLVPPLFYLEFSGPGKNNVNDQEFFKQTLVNITKDAGGILAGVGPATLGEDKNPISSFLLKNVKRTPEDDEALKTYTVSSTNLKQNQPSSNGVIANIQSVDQKLAWVYSDVYLGTTGTIGVLTFEHQYIWNLCTETAARCLREVFFDFKPKLKKDAVASYDNELVSELQRSPHSQNGYDDIHPNIGILKYRLSPCFLPYDDKPGSNFWHYKFATKDIMSYQALETERKTFTVILGYGSGLNNVSLAEGLLSLATEESKKFAIAQSVDPLLEKRLGYRFSSDHDAKMTIPILQGLVSYAQLMKSQLSMFSQQISIPGRPDIQAGSIVYLVDRNADFYCTRVSHIWSLNGGYKTVLSLEYGHHHGQLPTAMAGVLTVSGDPTISKSQCDNNHKIIKEYTKNVSKNIGDVDFECLIEALWDFWSESTTSDAVLENKTREYALGVQSGAIKDTRDDWVKLTAKGSISNKYDSLFTKYINDFHLDKYGVTLNTVKNIVGNESGYVENITSKPNKNGSADYGLFQINFATPGTVVENGLTTAGAQVATIAAPVAFGRLLSGFTSVSNNPQILTKEQFLIAITGYNSGPGNAKSDFSGGRTYVNAVFGADEVQAIIDGKRGPGISNFGGASVSSHVPWPYYTYGPLGIRVGQSKSNLATVNPRSGDANYVAEKKQLLTFSYGMKAGIEYLSRVMKKFQDPKTKVTYMVDGKQTDVLDSIIKQDSLLEKTITAWYTNEIQQSFDPKLDATQLRNIIDDLIQRYHSCRQCQSQSENQFSVNPPGNGTINERILNAALNFQGTSTADGPGGGGEACVFAVQKVLGLAGIQPMANGTLFEPTFVEQGKSSGRLSGPISESLLKKGDIWVIDGPTVGHIGIVIDTNPIRILSNSSSQRAFKWNDLAPAYLKAYGYAGTVSYYRVLS